MGTEIERKFLLLNDEWRPAVLRSELMTQGYMRSPDATLRVRVIGDLAKFTIKGRTVGVTRGEWEFDIPAGDGSELIEQFCGKRVIKKTRHYLQVGEHEWTIDEFHDRHDGLFLAEIELESEAETFDQPGWLGREVSHESRYFNEALAAPRDDTM